MSESNLRNVIDSACKDYNDLLRAFGSQEKDYIGNIGGLGSGRD